MLGFILFLCSIVLSNPVVASFTLVFCFLLVGRSALLLTLVLQLQWFWHQQQYTTAGSLCVHPFTGAPGLRNLEVGSHEFSRELSVLFECKDCRHIWVVID